MPAKAAQPKPFCALDVQCLTAGVHEPDSAVATRSIHHLLRHIGRYQPQSYSASTWRCLTEHIYEPDSAAVTCRAIKGTDVLSASATLCLGCSVPQRPH